MPSSNGSPQACAIAERGGHAGIGHRHDDVGLGRRLAREFRAHRLARLVDAAPVHDRIRPGEIDVFEDAGPHALRRKRLQARHAVGVDDDHFAVLDVAHEFRADDVERARLRGQDRTAVEFAEHQRADAERIARADQFLVGERDQRIGALDAAQRLDEAVDDSGLARAGGEHQHDFGVRGRLADRAAARSVRAAASGRW